MNHPMMRRQPTVLNLRRIGLVLVLGALLIGGGVVWVLRTQTRPVQAAVADVGTVPGWMAQSRAYAAPDPATPKATPPDTTTAELAALKARLAQQEQELEALKKRPVVRPVPPPAPAPKPEKKVSPTMLFVDYSPKDAAAPKKTTREYTLAPGATKLPCTVETVINSDVEGYFTAKVSTNVYDTATGTHLLVPQGSTILGHDRSSTLLYGNERLPTVSLTLALADSRSVDLGQAPVVDQRGVAGLTGTVDTHFWRNLTAVFIGGTLRGGAQAVQAGIAGAGATGQVASGIAQTGSQFGQQQTGRAIDTRPTIMVDAGQLCHVLLVKPLALPAMWE